MSPLWASVIAVGAISLVSLAGLAMLSLRQSLVRRTLFLLVALAAGALLGDAFIHLIPEAFSAVDTTLAALCVLGGILLFFLLEKYLHWHHSHGDEEYSPEHARIHPIGNLVLISDGVHNLIDGIAVGAAFMVSTEIGIATTIAIALHEIPQEISDFGLLLHAGFSRAKALFMNFISALTAFAGLALVFWLGEAHAGFVPLIAAFTAGNFIYIALADLVPELQKTTEGKRSFIQVAVVLLGIGLMLALSMFETLGS
ncbi:MAG: ZIP family metal transporter [Minisyncoccia bacterium]